MLAALAMVAVFAAGAPVPPSPTRWVEDHAEFLTPAARASLDARLEGYERATGHQVIVWIGKTIEGAALDDWAVRTFAAWKLGRKGLDDGIAMFILADDRKIDIEVGYGLEDKVPDAIASRIIREVMAPRIRAGDRDGAVAAGVDSVLAAIEGRPWAGTTAPPRRAPSPITWILGGLGTIAFLIFAITHPRTALLLLWTIMPGGRRGGGGGLFGGGGFGGGGFGGGFGGGGGSSGGGGARGGW